MASNRALRTQPRTADLMHELTDQAARDINQKWASQWTRRGRNEWPRASTGLGWRGRPPYLCQDHPLSQRRHGLECSPPARWLRRDIHVLEFSGVEAMHNWHRPGTLAVRSGLNRQKQFPLLPGVLRVPCWILRCRKRP